MTLETVATLVPALEAVATLGPVLEMIGPFTERQLGLGLFFVLFGGAGLFLLYVGLTNLRSAGSIFLSDPVPADEARRASGVVEVTGTAEPLDETTSTRYTGTPVVAHSFTQKRKEFERDADGNRETEWETVESGDSAVPFLVADDSGSIPVAPEDATITLDTTQVSSGRKERRYEGRLEPGDQVHVYGQIVDAADAAVSADEDVAIGGGDTAPTFTVSDTTERRTILRFGLKGVGAMIASMLFLGVVAAILWIEFDPLGAVIVAPLVG